VARIVVTLYAVRFPVGGYLSAALQWLLGLRRLGHDVYLFENAGLKNACYHQPTDSMTDDPAYGVGVLSSLLARFGLANRWCFVDVHGRHHGLGEAEAEAVLAGCDLLLDALVDPVWHTRVGNGTARVLLDIDPALCQMRLEKDAAAGRPQPEYDAYCTLGFNIGTGRSTAPAAGKRWRHFFHPVVIDLFDSPPPAPDARWTTVTSWHAIEPLEFGGRVYGGKERELEKFESLPGRTEAQLELAVGGRGSRAFPRERMRSLDWSIVEAVDVASSFDDYRTYVSSSRGEFSICENIVVDTWSGWFSDRSAVYLACGRPVVMQDTGFSEHLPCGEGLIAVRDVGEAAEALDAVERDYERHSRAARRIAEEYLATDRVLPKLLAELGIDPP